MVLCGVARCGAASRTLRRVARVWCGVRCGHAAPCVARGGCGAAWAGWGWAVRAYRAVWYGNRTERSVSKRS